MGAVVAVVVIAALVALVVMRGGAGPQGDGALRAVVHDGDGGVHELSLSEDRELTVSTSKGVNVVTVRDGSVLVSEADCDNHDCMRQGSINAPGSQIICLPHELWIEVVANGQRSGDMNLDAVSGSVGGYDVVAR